MNEWQGPAFWLYVDIFASVACWFYKLICEIVVLEYKNR